MSAISKYDVLGLANPFCDSTALVNDDFLKKHGLTKGICTFTQNKSEVDAVWNDLKEKNENWTIGGSATNVIKTLARLGYPCGAYGIVAPDAEGNEIEKRLNQIGITSLLSKEGKETGKVRCYINSEKENETDHERERTMHSYMGASETLSVKHVKPAYFENIQHLVLVGYDMYFEDGNVVKKSIECAQKATATISLDLANQKLVEIQRKNFEECIPKVDFVFGNISEMLSLKGCEKIDEALECFDTHQTVIATNGGKGCWAKCKGETDVNHYTLDKVSNVQDTTGAGDFFSAGFLHGHFQKADISKCIQKGHQAASFVIREFGAELPEDKWEQLKNALAKV
jgi:sugar/nucleoside kinase (ribokinase family)